MQNLRNERGQGLVEYILIVALMGILAIAAVKNLGNETHQGFSTAASKLQKEFKGM